MYVCMYVWYVAMEWARSRINQSNSGILEIALESG